MVLEAAVVVRCDSIVTFNLKDFVGTEKFGLRALTPVDFLRMLENEHDPSGSS